MLWTISQVFIYFARLCSLGKKWGGELILLWHSYTLRNTCRLWRPGHDGPGSVWNLASLVPRAFTLKLLPRHLRGRERFNDFFEWPEPLEKQSLLPPVLITRFTCDLLTPNPESDLLSPDYPSVPTTSFWRQSWTMLGKQTHIVIGCWLLDLDGLCL